MIKKNMPIIIITSLITILPAVLMKSIMPLILLLIHLICIYVTSKDKGNENQNSKVFQMIFWVCPIIAVYTSAVNYMVVSGMDPEVDLFIATIIGLMFVVIGNYLPKIKQNSTIGIKIPWTYSSEENWNKTHRFGGKVWVVCGLLMMFSVFMPGGIGEIVLIGAIFIMLLVPIFYSYLLYRKEKREGKANLAMLSAGTGKRSGIFLIVILAFVAVMMFTGDIEFTCEEDALVIEADYWADMTIKYDDIQSVKYLENDIKGSRIGGFGSARLLMGTFENEEYGYYTRYSYTKCDVGIEINLGKSMLIISGKNVENSEKLYEELENAKRDRAK